MRTWIALALVLSAALSGCAGEESSTPDATPTTDDSGGQNQTATATSSSTTSAPAPGNETEPQPNTPPTAELTADVVNGTAPLNVTFTLGGEDADGDALDWTLTVNGTQAANGTSLPATFTYNFTEAGNFSVVLAVTDGMNSTEANLTITVALALPTGPFHVVEGSTSLTGMPWTSGLILGGTPGTGAKGCVGFAAGENGQDCYWGTLPEGSAGRAYNFTSTTSAPWVEILSACSMTADVVQPFDDAQHGTVPDGAGCVVMWNYGTGTGSFRFEVL